MESIKTISGIPPESVKKFIQDHVLLFRELPVTALDTLSRRFTAIGCKSGIAIIRQGEMGDFFYIVISGKFSVTVRNSEGIEKKVGEIFPGDCAGEGALITREPRNATVTADSTAKLLRLSYEDFQDILARNPAEFQALVRVISKRSRTVNPSQFRPSPEKLSKFLSSVDLLSSIDEEAIREIESKMEWLFLPGGELLMRQGDPGDSMYIVVNGGFRYVVKDGEDSVVAEGRFGKGDIIGEMALLTGESRSATVFSTRGSELVRFSNKTFEEFITNNPRAMMGITRTIARRLQGEMNKSGRRAKKKTSTILTFLSISPEVPDNIDELLLSACPPDLKAVSATRSGFLQQRDRAVRNDRYDISEVFSWLYRLEEENDLVLLFSDTSDPVWTETVLRHTDKIVLLTTSETAASLSPAEIRYLGDSTDETSAPCELVILYTNRSEKPSNTLERMKSRKVARHYHIRLYLDQDISRLMRCLTGKSIGLALGGGGAKGFAHIGLLRAFSEQAISVDIVGGTSAGAIFAALYSLGLDIDSIERMSRQFMSGGAILEDYTYPLISLVRGKRFTRALKSVFGDIKIEDLWIPYFAVATDLTDARKFVFKTGPLWKAVRASASLPGILPPLFLDGRLLVDGALLDNVPGGLLKEFGAGKTIASSLGFRSRMEADKFYRVFYDKENRSISPSFFRSLWWKIRPFGKNQTPAGIGNILTRSTMVNSLAMEKNTSREVDLFISLPVGDYGIFDWKMFDGIVSAGYRYARENIQDWKKRLSER